MCMCETVITPNMRDLIGKNDSESIQNAIDRAHISGINSVTVPRINGRTGEAVWNIGKAIILPSDMELVLDNCHLRQEDGCFDNMFRNFSDTDAEGHSASEQKRRIRIRGVGNAVLDGGHHNGLTQKTSLQDGMPHITRNSLILFYNLRDFVIENLTLKDQRFWAVDLIHAERGRLSNLFIDGQCDCRNQDGIDIRVGCSNIIIENITGQSGDDIIALSAIGNRENPTNLTYMYRVEGHDEDIHDIIIKNVIATSVECAAIALRNCDGRKIYNITIDNIHCNDNYAFEDGKTYPEYPTFKLFKPENSSLHRILKGNIPYALIRIGQHGYYGKRNAVLGELYNIHATNLHMYKGSVIVANVALENCYFGNIYAENDVDHILTTMDDRDTALKGAQMCNVVFENIFYRNCDNEYAVAFDLPLSEEIGHYRIDGLFIKNAFLGNCRNIFNMGHCGQINYRDIYGTFVEKTDGILGK